MTLLKESSKQKINIAELHSKEKSNRGLHYQEAGGLKISMSP
jgi:hypothetical protein